MEEKLVFILKYKDIFIFVKLVRTLILGLLKTNASMKEKESKWSAVDSNGLSNIERVFLLLAKLVTVYE